MQSHVQCLGLQQLFLSCSSVKYLWEKLSSWRCPCWDDCFSFSSLKHGNGNCSKRKRVALCKRMKEPGHCGACYCCLCCLVCMKHIGWDGHAETCKKACTLGLLLVWLDLGQWICWPWLQIGFKWALRPNQKIIIIITIKIQMKIWLQYEKNKNNSDKSKYGIKTWLNTK